MAGISRILALIKISTFGVNSLLALIYALPILLVHRFHHRLNILTVNICISTVCVSGFWMVYFTMWEYYLEYLFTPETCTFLFYLQSIIICMIPFTFTIVTINRVCSVVHPTKAFFKTKKFLVLCLISPWIVACVVSLPFALKIEPYCVVPRWMSIYTFVIAIVIPSLITLIGNLRIFQYAHSSTRRVRPKNDTNLEGVTMGQQQQAMANRRDLHLIRHIIFMFCLFVIGWGPIFMLVAIDYDGNVVPLVYTILQLVASCSMLSCMINLLLYNKELRQYITNKICPCF